VQASSFWQLKWQPPAAHSGDSDAAPVFVDLAFASLVLSSPVLPSFELGGFSFRTSLDPPL
jgi:hypothetical protein